MQGLSENCASVSPAYVRRVSGSKANAAMVTVTVIEQPGLAADDLFWLQVS
jgi:hypothetical protein